MTEVTRERVRPSLSLYLLILHPVPTNRSAPSLAPFFLGVRIPCPQKRKPLRDLYLCNYFPFLSSVLSQPNLFLYRKVPKFSYFI